MQSVEEYRTLRHEILLRIAIQNAALLSLMPLLLASVIAAALRPDFASEIALTSVGVSGMAALYWIHSAARTVQLKAYFRTVEEETGTLGWESWLANSKFQGPLGSRWFISTKSVFVGVQAAALFICGVLVGDPLEDFFLLALGGGVMILTAILLIQPKLAT